MSNNNTVPVNLNNVVDSIPQSTSGTGTIEYVNGGKEVIGTTTVFETELNLFGDWLVIIDGANRQIVEIEQVVDDTHLVLRFPITIPTASGVSMSFIPRIPVMKDWAATNTGATAATMNGITWPAGLTRSPDRTEKQDNQPSPVIIDATGTTIDGTIVY